MSTEENSTITAIPGILVGQVQDAVALTGCTVILTEAGAVAGVDQRGGAPGTRETDLLRPMHLVEKVHGVLLSGGSAFGLDAASGVMRFLEEKGLGFDTLVARVPIVPAAVLFDLMIGDPNTRPTAEMGYRACQVASDDPVTQGNYGAGCGATVGKIFGLDYAMKTGIGSACISLDEEVQVGALVAVNAFGDVIDPQTSNIIAGARQPEADNQNSSRSNHFLNTLQVLGTSAGQKRGFSGPINTVIGVIATNAKLTKEEANKVAQMAQDGIARTIRPAHTMNDGDTLFALSIGEQHADVTTIGAFAAEMIAQAILNGVRFATGAGGVPSLGDMNIETGEL